VSGFADYEACDALGLADLVARRLVTPEQLLDAAIERVDGRNQAVNALERRRGRGVGARIVPMAHASDGFGSSARRPRAAASWPEADPGPEHDGALQRRGAGRNLDRAGRHAQRARLGRR
jgi:hypothetical protein